MQSLPTSGLCHFQRGHFSAPWGKKVARMFEGMFDGLINKSELLRSLRNFCTQALSRVMRYLPNLFNVSLHVGAPAEDRLHAWDIRPDNIMVQMVEGNRCVVTGLIDWDYSSFYPEYYESVRCTHCLAPNETNDWYLFLPKNITRNAMPIGGCSTEFERQGLSDGGRKLWKYQGTLLHDWLSFLLQYLSRLKVLFIVAVQMISPLPGHRGPPVHTPGSPIQWFHYQWVLR